MATYNISMTKGTGISGFYYGYYDSTNTWRSGLYASATTTTIAVYSGTDVYVYGVTFKSGYTYPVKCGSWEMYDEYGAEDDPYIRSNANRSLTISATAQSAATTYKLYVECDGVSIGYRVSTTGATGTLSDGLSRTFDFGTTRGYIQLTSVTPSTGYVHPVAGSATTGTTSWDVTNSSGTILDNTIYAYSGGGIRYVTLSAKKGATTYYGRLNLNANGGTINNSTYAYYPYPAKGVSSEGNGATVSITIPSTSTYLPTRDGYKFVGWARSSTATSADYDVGDSVGVWSTSTYQSSPAELILYAVWEERPDIALFYWNGSDTADASLIAKGKPVTNITATRWNNLLAKIKELSDAVGVSFSYTTVSSGSQITAARFNAARTGLANIKTALGTTTVLPAEQYSGYVVYATLFTGNGSIKGALNALIGVYNNG